MSEKTPPPEDPLPPLDDSGINNDKIIDVCEHIIDGLWQKCVDNPDKKEFSVAEYKDMAQTLLSVWGLVQGILELDYEVRKQFEDDGDDPLGDLLDLEDPPDDEDD